MLETIGEDAALSMLSGITGDSRVHAEIAASKILVRQCGALPLALRIAAARLRRHPHWTVASLVARLKDEQNRLNELRVADMEVRACIALSYEDLGPGDAESFRKLAVIPGHDFTSEVAAAALDMDPAGALHALDELADAQLIEYLTAGRYRYHDLIRIFAGEKLQEEEPPAGRTAMLQRVLNYYADRLDVVTDAIMASSAVGAKALGQSASSRRSITSGSAPSGNGTSDLEASAYEWMQAESKNMTDALYASQRADPALTWRLARSLLLYSENRVAATELQAMLQVAEQAAADLGDRDAAMSVLYFRGRVARLSSRLPEAIRSLSRSARYFSDAGEDQEASEILLVLGQAYREHRNLKEAADALLRSFRLRYARQDAAGTAGTLIEIAILLKEHHQLENAASVLEFAIQVLDRDSGSPAGMAPSKARLAYAHENLGAILKWLGRASEAMAHHKASLQAFTEIGNRGGQAFAEGNLGDLLLAAGNLREAEEKYARNLQGFRDIQYRRGEAQALARLSLIRLRRRHYLAALATLAECLVVSQRAGYLSEQLRQLRAYRARNKRPPQAPAANPLLDGLANTIMEARGIAP
jgi:tetratricopeptide (TPR) repeat protein